MELSAGIQASLAGRYATALFDLASEAGTVTAVESDLDNIESALGEFGRTARPDPQPRNQPRSDRPGHGAASVRPSQLTELTRNFLGVLAENRRLAELPAMIRAFHAIAAAQRGEVTAEVASAHALSDKQVAALEGKLRAREGRTVKLKTRVDPSLLGGLVVTIGSKRIDGSIRTRLNSLAQAMKG